MNEKKGRAYVFSRMGIMKIQIYPSSSKIKRLELGNRFDQILFKIGLIHSVLIYFLFLKMKLKKM